MASRVAVFIDGAYLDKIAEREFGMFIDFEKLNQQILQSMSTSVSDVELVRTYYYHCLPYQSNPPTASEAERFGRKQRFFESLTHIRRFVVRTGRLAFRGITSNGEPIFQQKRTDLMLGLDLALLSGKGQLNHIVCVAGDSDLLPAFEVAKEEGLVVWLMHGPRHSRTDGTCTFAQELWQSADERIEIDLAFMQAIQKIRVPNSRPNGNR